MIPSYSDYQQLLTDIERRVREAQYKALQAVNQEQIGLYYEMGRLIVERLFPYAAILRSVQPRSTSPTIGWRNKLEQTPANPE